MQVHRLALHDSNAYVINGDHSILVDTGASRSRSALLDALARIGISGEQLSLVLLTHVHAASVGNAAYLQQRFHVPVAVHGADAPILASGVDRSGHVANPIARLLRSMDDTRFDAALPDVVLGHSLALTAFGVDATVVHTPGHTIGSTSVVLPNGDALVGDLLTGGFFGGRLFPTSPRVHAFAEDPERVARSLALLERLGVQRLFPATGEMLSMAEVRSRIIDRAPSIASGPAPARVRERRLREQPPLGV